MGSYCDDVATNPNAWFFERGYCAVGDALTVPVEGATALGSQAIAGSQAVAAGAIKGAQGAAGQLAGAIGTVGSPKINLSAGSVLALAALGVGGALLADAYLTGGQVTRSFGRAVTGGRR